MTTVVLLHGAGHVSRVWRRFSAILGRPTVAPDFPGRGSRPADLTAVTLADSAASVAADVRSATEGPWVVVAHSFAGIMAPRVVAELGDVEHLILVGGMCAAHGGRAIDVVDPERKLDFEARRAPELSRWRDHSYVADDLEEAALPEHLLPLRDRTTLQFLDSVVAMYEPVSWDGVPVDLPRTWVRPLRDSVQPPDVQDRLIAAYGATRVPVIDTNHAPHLEDPIELAKIIDDVLDAT